MIQVPRMKKRKISESSDFTYFMNEDLGAKLNDEIIPSLNSLISRVTELATVITALNKKIQEWENK